MVCCMASSDSGSKGNHSSYQVVSKRVFEKDEWDESLLLIHLKQGCSLMLSKLTSYTKDQLPGGQYWNPAPEVEEVLRKLAPSNDLCESILGLNDSLVTALPNMDQLTRSNMVQVKKSKSVQWLENLPKEQQENVVKFAMKHRSEVVKDYNEHRSEVKWQRSGEIV